jgi:alpha-galactosidase
MVVILSFPELADSTIALHDIDPARLETSTRVANHLAKKLNAHPTIEASLDRRQALDGADYAISMFQVGGYKPATVIDFDIPKQYGLRHWLQVKQFCGLSSQKLATIHV